MKALKVISMYESILESTENKKQVNYDVVFDIVTEDGETRKTMKVRAVSGDDAEKIVREKMRTRYKSKLKGVDIIAARKS